MALCHLFCILLPRTRAYYFKTFSDEIKELKSICYDTVNIYTKGVPWWKVPLNYLILVLAMPFMCLLGIVAIPLLCLYRYVRGWDMTVIKKVDYRDYLTPAKPRDWEEEKRKNDEYWRQMHSYLFYVKKKNISFSPDTKEVFFYTPYSCSALETLISENLEEIRGLFNEKGLTFIFLPDFNNPKIRNYHPIHD